MNDVRIDGVRYVPVTKNPNSHHINRLSRILDKQCPYLSHTVRNNIIKEFKSDELISVVEPNHEPSKKQEHCFSVSNFDGTDDEGYVIFKIGKHRKSSWTVYQVAEIRQWLTYGKYMSDSDRINQLSEKFDLSHATLRNIICSLKDEKFCDWIDSKISNDGKDADVEEKPKREDVGWFE